MTAFEQSWSAQDQRSSSTQSLVPSESNQQNDRRRLLLIYVHGFMGNETSFRSFPAHVHNLLTVLLVDTHVVHTKVYPRYRSKKNITVARDNFSAWLEPHEDATTDVVLLGHSMGGLLIAEVALMRPAAPASRPLKHRLLGTINFDVPFLGMHPGVVKSGLGSIFKPAEDPADKWSAVQSGVDDARSATSPVGRNDTLWTPDQPDPNFNPSFQNDVVLPMRKGWQNTLHFIKKHSDNLGKATTQLVTSHLEFGGAMANYPELKARYGKIRALEEESENVRKSTLKAESVPPRVRFVNYYTASTGRIKKPKPHSPSRLLSPSSNHSRTSLSPEEAQRGRSRDGHVAATDSASRSASPRISLEEHSDEGVVKKEVEMPSSGEEDWDDAAETLAIGDPQEQTRDVTGEILSPTASLATTASLPPVPDLPRPPPPLNVSYIQDVATQKLVEKEHARALKAYEKAVRDREKVIQARAKLEQKKERRAQSDAQKTAKAAERAAKLQARNQVSQAPPAELTQSQKEHMRLEAERIRMEAESRRMRGEPSPENHKQEVQDETQQTQPSTDAAPTAPLQPPSSPARTPPLQSPSSLSPSPSRSSQLQDASTQPKKQLKDRKFCTLPPKDSAGQRDPLWVRVFMENVDEVGAHCGLFFVDERYERLVGEVGGRVEGWVRGSEGGVGL